MMNKPSLIFSSDWHLRSDTPKCRTDDFLRTQINKVKFVSSIANKHRIPTVIAGDIGQGPIKNWPPRLLRLVIELFSRFEHGIYLVPGQHDLPNHDIERTEDSGLGVLISAKVVVPLFYDKSREVASEIVSVNGLDIGLVGFPYGVDVCDCELEREVDRKVAVVHAMVIESKKLWSQQNSYSLATHLLRKNDYDAIVSGDNHLPFTSEYRGKVLANCGSLSRQRSDQIDHKPRVYLYYGDTNTVEPVYIPIDENAVSEKFRKSEVEQDERMERYVEALDVDYEVGLKFEENLRTSLDVNKEVKQSVKEKVWESYENAGTEIA